jgi:hypothetical protein
MTTEIARKRDPKIKTGLSFIAEGDADQLERLRMFIKADEWCGVHGWGRARRRGAGLEVTLESIRGDVDAVIAVLIERFPTLNLLWGYVTRTAGWNFNYRDGSYEEEYRDAAGDVWVWCPGHYEKAAL